MNATLNFPFNRKSKSFSDWKDNVIKMQHYFQGEHMIVKPIRTEHRWK